MRLQSWTARVLRTPPNVGMHMHGHDLVVSPSPPPSLTPFLTCSTCQHATCLACRVCCWVSVVSHTFTLQHHTSTPAGGACCSMHRCGPFPCPSVRQLGPVASSHTLRTSTPHTNRWDLRVTTSHTLHTFTPRTTGDVHAAERIARAQNLNCDV